MEDAPRMDESAEDMTAAVTAPSPTKVIAGGVMYWRVIGRTNLAFFSGNGNVTLYPAPCQSAFEKIKEILNTPCTQMLLEVILFRGRFGCGWGLDAPANPSATIL